MLYHGSLDISLSSKSKVLHECRLKVLGIQKTLSSELKKLLKLNKKARNLRRRKNAAQLRLMAAIASQNAPLVISLRAEIKYLTQLQFLLDGKQRLIISGAELKHKKWKANNKAAKKSDPKALAIVPYGTGLAPEYKASSNFVNQQKISLKQKVNLPDHLKLIHKDNFQIECAASIEEQKIGGKQWEHTLVAAKSL